MKKIFLCIIFIASSVQASNLESFIALVKKTSSVYSGSVEIDKNNLHTTNFETLLVNQKVFLTISSSKMNSTVYTLINSDANEETKKRFKALPPPPTVLVSNLNIVIDDKALCSEVGDDVGAMDTSCTGKKCSLKQLIISKCNETECWEEDVSTPRLLLGELSEAFNLKERANVSSCLLNNSEGIKHRLVITELGDDTGGAISYQIIVANDIEE